MAVDTVDIGAAAAVEVPRGSATAGETMPGGMTVACPAAHMNGHAT